MWLDRLLASRTRTALELSARFAEERHRVLAENVANVDTPDYQARSLDSKAFTASLREALEGARAGNSQALELRGNAQFRQEPDGRLRVKPSTARAGNALFHDGTNANLDAMMGDVMSNALQYNLAMNLLRSRFNGMMSAIRGRQA